MHELVLDLKEEEQVVDFGINFVMVGKDSRDYFVVVVVGQLK